MPQITKSKATRKPEKPTADFPLFAHASGQWAKKIKGRMCYFGVWSAPDAAFAEYNRQKRFLERGEAAPDECTIGQLVYDFLVAKEARVKTGELSQRSFKDYTRVCQNIVRRFGEDQIVRKLSPSDFAKFRTKMAETLNFQSLGNELNRIKIVFRFGEKQGKYPKPEYGTEFDRPSRKVLRAERQKKQREHGKRMLQSDELRLLLSALDGNPVIAKGADEPITIPRDPVMKAMVLLACNCGLGQSDLSGLPISAIDLEAAIIDYPRPKTAVERICPLWPETIQAVREALPLRPKAKRQEHDALLFLTRSGTPWIKVTAKSNDDAIAKEFSKLLVTLKLKRVGLNFYCLRHTFETVAGAAKDPVAVSAIMGHVDSTMAGLYREEIGIDRLQAVTDVVHRWLWPAT